MTPQNPKMLTVKYKKKNMWHFALQVIEDLAKHNIHREKCLVKYESCRNHSRLVYYLCGKGRADQIPLILLCGVFLYNLMWPQILSEKHMLFKGRLDYERLPRIFCFADLLLKCTVGWAVCCYFRLRIAMLWASCADVWHHT